MRNLGMMKGWPVCLIAAAAAACADPAATNGAADANAAARAEVAADANAAGDAAAGGNLAAPAPAAGNGSSGSDESYHASGVDPYWALTIGGGQMVYTTPDGPAITVATPPQQPTRAGYRYVTPELTVGVVHRQCQGVDEQFYADTVHVLVGGRTVRGCGE